MSIKKKHFSLFNGLLFFSDDCLGYFGAADNCECTIFMQNTALIKNIVSNHGVWK